MREDLLKHQVKSWLKGEWISFVQPSIGSTIGMADLSVLVPGIGLSLPVELKVASILLEEKGEYLKKYTEDGDVICSIAEGKPKRLRPSYMRPTQIEWHDTLRRAGGKSRFLFGVCDSSRSATTWWDAWILDDCWLGTLKDWKAGFSLDPANTKLTRIVTESRFDAETWWRGLIPDKA